MSLHTCYIVLVVHCLSVWSLPDNYWYNEWRFREQVNRALHVVEGILNTTRHPTLPDLADNHTYDDKYTLIETMTNTAIASYITVLQHLGLQHVDEIVKWVQKQHRPVVLRFEMNPTCVFDRRAERQIVTSEVEIETSQGGSGLVGRFTKEQENIKIKRTVVEYFWNVTAAYRLTLVSGDDEIELQTRDEAHAVTSVKVNGGSLEEYRIPESPLANSGRSLHEVPMTWLFENIRMVETADSNGTDKAPKVTLFSIDRLARKCKTPSQNDDVNKAWSFADRLVEWANAVSGSFRALNDCISGTESYWEWPTKNNDGSQSTIFSPIIPLFENSKVLPHTDFVTLLQTHNTSLTNYIDQTVGSFPEKGLMSRQEVKIVTLLDHLGRHDYGLVNDWQGSIGLVEKLLVDQLIKAVGKVIIAADFEEFMTFHNRRLLRPAFAPKSFAYAVRNGTTSFPDGLFSIEADLKSKSVPIETTVRHMARSAGRTSVSIPLTAATSVEIQGDLSIHGWLRYQWEGEMANLNLHARANQFSSFVLLTGKMDGNDLFLPMDAIILQNKDDVLVPLLAKVLPSAKEFKDAVSSLSPEQRAFAEAFRSMQLQSSVFGICVIQIKPQLERLLNLPAKSLAKEIQLTEDLMYLFVEYQIPSDLLSFEGDHDVSPREKVEAVRGYVKAVTDVIEGAKKKQLEEESQKAKMKQHKTGVDTATTDSSTEGPAARASSSTSSRRVLQATTMTFSAPESHEVFESYTVSAGNEPPSFDSTTGGTEDRSSYAEMNHDNDRDVTSLDDFTKIPMILDKKLESLDPDGALKSTILEAGSTWSRSRQENLLEAPQKSYLYRDDIKKETNNAMDLLTALSRSGSLPIRSSELHIVVTVTHCFAKSVINTVIKDNVNPIEKVEKSLLLLASTIQQVESSQLLSQKHDMKSNQRQ